MQKLVFRFYFAFLEVLKSQQEQKLRFIDLLFLKKILKIHQILIFQGLIKMQLSDLLDLVQGILRSKYVVEHSLNATKTF